MLNQHGYIEDWAFGITIGSVLVLVLIVAAIIGTARQGESPCESYKNWALKDVPARCVKEFTDEH